MKYAEDKFNQQLTMRMQRTVEFIKLHYCISERRDSQYWIDNCDPISIPDNLKQRLAFWQGQVPTKYDFENAWEPFNLDSYLYVLYGMGFETNVANVAAKYTERVKAEHLFNNIDKASLLLMDKLPKQRELIEKVIKYGFTQV